MADIEQQVMLDFKTNVTQVTQEMSDLRQQMSLVKKEQKQLNQDFENGVITQDEYTKGMIASENQLKDYQKQMSVLSARSFKELGNAFKEGVLGASSFGEAVKNGATIAGKSIKMLFANPLGIAITLLTGLVSSIKNVIAKNDTLATSFGKLGELATIPLRLIERALTPLAKGLGFVVDKINSFVGKISPMANDLNTITDLTEKLEDAQNNYNLAAAATEITLNNLKTIYDDSTRPLKERIEALKEAKDAELALAEMQNNINRMEFERSVLEAKNDQKWKAHQKAAFDLMKYDPSKSLQENIENFEWQMGKIGDLDQELKDKLYKSYTAYVTSNNAISRINAEFVRKESSLINQANKETVKTASDSQEKVEDILANNQKISEDIFNSIVANYDELRQLTERYNRQIEQRTQERNNILSKIEKAKSKETRNAYQEQLRLFDQFTAQLTFKYQQDIAQLHTKIPAPDTSSIFEAVKGAENEIKQSLGDFNADFASLITEDVDSLSFNLDLTNEKIKEWVNQNAENITTTANIFGSVGDILGGISDMIQGDYDAIMAKGDEMTASDIAQAKVLAKKQKALADAQIILNEVMSIGNALVAASSAAAQSVVPAPST